MLGSSRLEMLLMRGEALSAVRIWYVCSAPPEHETSAPGSVAGSAAEWPIRRAPSHSTSQGVVTAGGLMVLWRR
jgi:hypothetical protein